MRISDWLEPFAISSDLCTLAAFQPITATMYTILAYAVILQIKRSDSAFFWEEREIMANANSTWIVMVRPSVKLHQYPSLSGT